MNFKTIILGLTALASAASASAATNLVINGNFEANGPAFLYADGDGNTNITGWTTYGVHGSYPLIWLADPAAGFVYNYVASPDGGSALISDGAFTYQAGTAQSIAGLTIGGRYELKFYWAAGQQEGFPGPTFDKYYTVAFGGDSFSTTPQAGPQGGFQGWFTETHRFTATSTSQVLSFLASGSPDGVPPFTMLDGVSLTSVPEASTWAMLIAGFGLVGAAARRRRTAAAA